MDSVSSRLARLKRYLSEQQGAVAIGDQDQAYWDARNRAGEAAHYASLDLAERERCTLLRINSLTDGRTCSVFLGQVRCDHHLTDALCGPDGDRVLPVLLVIIDLGRHRRGVRLCADPAAPPLDGEDIAAVLDLCRSLHNHPDYRPRHLTTPADLRTMHPLMRSDDPSLVDAADAQVYPLGPPLPACPHCADAFA